MKILYITVNPMSPPLSGHDIRISSQLEALQRICEVKTFSLSGKSPFEESVEHKDLGKETRELNNFLATQIIRGNLKPFSHHRNQEVLNRLQKEIGDVKFDYVIYSGLESASVYEDVSTLLPNAIRILDLDESSYRWSNLLLKMPVSSVQQMVWKKYFPNIHKLEDSLIKASDQVWVCSPIELDSVRKRHPHHKGLRLIPNSLGIISHKRSSTISKDRRRLLYVGSFTHLPNQFAVNELVKEIIPLLPDFNLEVVGRDIPESWLSELNNQVKYFSNVLDLEPHYQRASAVVLPLRAGAGTRIKVLEAIQYGLPVVSTAFGVEGMGFLEDQHYLRAETKEEFVAQISRLVDEPGLSDQLISQANILLENEFSIDVLEREISKNLSLN